MADAQTDAPNDAVAEASGAGGEQTCTLNRSWVFKTMIFLVVVGGFGLWSMIDALYAYPARGLADASVKLKDFLKAASDADRLTQSTLTVADPKGALAELAPREADLRQRTGGSGTEKRLADLELTKLEWLKALSRAWKLDASPKPLGTLKADRAPDRRLFFDPARGQGYVESEGARTDLTPQELFAASQAYWGKAPPPTELSAYDLPVQYLFMAAGVGWTAYLLFLLARCRAKSRSFRWEPVSRRLTIPGGASFTPGDLEDVDRRLWHKYYVTMVLAGGARHKLDLLRYEPLESWVVEMEHARFPERAAEAKAAEEAAAAAEAAAARAEEPAAAVQQEPAGAEEEGGARV